jgi:hypothetical protein
MEISVEELASLLNLVNIAEKEPATRKRTGPTRYNLVYGEVFREIAPLFGNPGPTHQQFGKMVSKVHEVTKGRIALEI